jgi:hypothetical protein
MRIGLEITSAGRLLQFGLIYAKLSLVPEYALDYE